MIIRGKARNPNPGGMFVFSFLCHALIFLVVLKSDLLPQGKEVETPAYYVDLVTLPVAFPQQGNPGAPATGPAEAPEAVAPPTPPAPSAPVLPATPSIPQGKQKASEKPAAKPQNDPARDEGRAFEERMAKVARAAEEKRYNEALARLRSGGGKVGVPGGKGTEAGSDYSSYIQSRLRDAFRSTIATETSAPRVLVHLTIGKDGRIVRYRIEQTSGDRVFEEAVQRAVYLAEKSFTPPPSGAQFEHGFVFRPQGVGVR